jgi:hypothetical protein
LAIVISRSTNGRSSLAFGTVVSIRSWRISAVRLVAEHRDAVLGDPSQLPVC